MQHEQFSDKAKQIIELIKNCKFMDKKTASDLELDNGKSWDIYNLSMIHYACSLFNIPQEYNEISAFCRSKNYWMDSK